MISQIRRFVHPSVGKQSVSSNDALIERERLSCVMLSCRETTMVNICVADNTNRCDALVGWVSRCRGVLATYIWGGTL